MISTLVGSFVFHMGQASARVSKHLRSDLQAMGMHMSNEEWDDFVEQKRQADVLRDVLNWDDWDDEVCREHARQSMFFTYDDRAGEFVLIYEGMRLVVPKEVLREFLWEDSFCVLDMLCKESGEDSETIEGWDHVFLSGLGVCFMYDERDPAFELFEDGILNVPYDKFLAYVNKYHELGYTI